VVQRERGAPYVAGRFGGEVHAAGDNLLLIDGRPVAVSRESDPAAVDWAAAGAEYIVDASGKFVTAEAAGAHLEVGLYKFTHSFKAPGFNPLT
jgi:glyceraldehyde 3-phosphate dehydrogenase